MTFTEWQQFATRLNARADRASRMIVDRARKVAEEAGLDSSIPFLHAHNAMCSLGQGRPWREVDYHGARLVLYLEEQSFIPHRLVSAVIERRWREVR